MFKKSLALTGLGVLGLGIGSVAHASPDLSGYFDTSLIAVKNKETIYRQQHLNLMLQHTQGIFKFMSEIEFEDATDIDYGDNGPFDHSTGAESARGRVFAERAYGEMNFSKQFNLRVGQQLHTSYYYLNHYPSLTTNYTDPLMKKMIFNWNMRGMLAFGEWNGLYYDAWTARGPVAKSGDIANKNLDNESGQDYGGKIGYTFNIPMGEFSLNLMAAKYSRESGVKADKSSGIELHGNVGKFSLLAEYGKRKQEDSSKTANAYYAIGSYSLDLGDHGELLPFFMYDNYRGDHDGTMLSQSRYALGLTYRPIPTISVKAEYVDMPKHTEDGANVLKSNQASLTFVYFYN